MAKIFSKLAASAITLMAVFCVAVLPAKARTVPPYENTAAYFLEEFEVEVTSGDEYALIALATFGKLPDKIYDKYFENVKAVTFENYTLGSMIQASFGKDASEYTAKLHGWKSGIYAMLSTTTLSYALNMIYTYYGKDEVTEAIFAEILSRYCGNGGFAYSSSWLEPDSDSSSQAFQGAWRYAEATQSDEVKAEFMKIPAYVLTDFNHETGAISSWGTDSPCGTAQALIAMTLADDMETAERLFSGLRNFALPHGAFEDVIDWDTMETGENYASTVQCFLALAAYELAQEGKYIFNFEKYEPERISTSHPDGEDNIIPTNPNTGGGSPFIPFIVILGVLPIAFLIRKGRAK